MAPELLYTEEAEALKALGRKIRDYQEARGFSDKEMERRFGGIGSTKTYKRILAGDLSELDLERQLANYRAVWALIEATAGADEVQEALYDDLTPVVLLRRAMLAILKETGNARVVLMEGDTGTGKTCALRRLVEKYGQRILPIQAWDCWGDSPMALLGAILTALGEQDQPLAMVPRLEKVIRRLRAQRVCLVIDEAHHLGPHQLNTIKGLVNDTPGEFVLLAMPTLWKRIERAAWEEVRQLTGNRLAERIKLGGLREADVRRLLERRAGVTDSRAVRKVASEAAARGNLAFVREVARRLAEKREPGQAPELEDVLAVVTAEMQRR